MLNDISVWWHIAGRADHRRRACLRARRTTSQPASCSPAIVNDTGLDSAWWYIIPIGLLLAQYTFTGYDASAHMTEETHNAATAGPRGIVMSILVSLGAGLAPAARHHLRHPEL